MHRNAYRSFCRIRSVSSEDGKAYSQATVTGTSVEVRMAWL
ncbi:hypothetical protein GGD50_000400 [Rhizobium paranaense]|uniref:Uncharacterized protein n=1 Tax=Rhizobium paranaense TaxID=1650438 RepID=A0A7W8XM92_9HYPH|nr:hypothetical protein [Rhizobium paranaense]